MAGTAAHSQAGGAIFLLPRQFACSEPIFALTKISKRIKTIEAIKRSGPGLGSRPDRFSSAQHVVYRRSAGRQAGYHLPILSRSFSCDVHEGAAIGQHIIIRIVMAAINHRRFSPANRSFLFSSLVAALPTATRVNTDEKSTRPIG